MQNSVGGIRLSHMGPNGCTKNQGEGERTKNQGREDGLFTRKKTYNKGEGRVKKLLMQTVHTRGCTLGAP